MVPNADVVRYLDSLPHYGAESKERSEFDELPVMSDVIRIFLVCDTVCTSTAAFIRSIFPADDMLKFTNHIDSRSRAISTVLRDFYESGYENSVEEGLCKFCSSHSLSLF